MVLRVPRVWWVLADGGAPLDSEADWIDRPGTLTLAGFRPTSPLHIGLLLPAPGWADEARVGITRGSSQSLEILRSESTAWFPLRNLGGDEALRRGDDGHSLRLWLRTGSNHYGPVEVARVARSQRHGSETEAAPQDISDLRPSRLMARLSRVARFGAPVARRAIDRLRETSYRKARRRAGTEAQQFLRRGLALLAAILDRGNTTGVSARWRRRADQLLATDPTAVAEWGRALRQVRRARHRPKQTRRGVS